MPQDHGRPDTEQHSGVGPFPHQHPVQHPEPARAAHGQVFYGHPAYDQAPHEGGPPHSAYQGHAPAQSGSGGRTRARAPKWRMPLILYASTWLSTYFAGSLGFWQFGEQFGPWAAFQFSAGIMTILSCHEMGHYLQTRRYKVPASLPYFLPVPISPFGTMGAVIGMDASIPNRRALFDIGISGPLAGLLPTFFFCVVGIKHSIPIPHALLETPYGKPLLYEWITTWVHGPLPPEIDLMPHPFAVAGWVGLFITSLNLLPIGQLDGGHVLYALLKKRAHLAATFLLYTLVVAVILFQAYAWFIMIVLLIMMGPKHQSTRNDTSKIGPARAILGWSTLCFVVIGFTPMPLLDMPSGHPKNRPPVYVNAPVETVEDAGDAPTSLSE